MTTTPLASPPEEIQAENTRIKGLVTLAGTEMWERFSFYGLQVLLAYYIYYSLTDGGLGLPQSVAFGVAGSYGGLLYIAQIGGAWITDHLFPARTVVLVGGIILMSGHVSLAIIPGLPGLICGLSLIVIGTGGLKVNSTMMVGQLYPEGGQKRDAAYSIFYMGITLGSFLGPLLTGVLNQSWGFHVAFGAAAVGMGLGLIQYAYGMRYLPESTKGVPDPITGTAKIVWAAIITCATVAVALLIVFSVIRVDNISDVVSTVILVASIGYFVMLLTNRDVTHDERRGVVRYIPIFFMSIVFWTLIFQLFTAFASYADTKVDLTLFGLSIAPTMPVTFNSLFVAIISAGLALVWRRTSNDARITPVVKLVVGLALTAAGAAAIVPFSIAAGESMPLLVAFLVMLIFALGESFFAPAILSVSSGHAPKAATAQMTALYFLTVGAGSTIAGSTSRFYSEGSEAQYFGTVAVVSLVLCLTLALAYRLTGVFFERRL